MLKFITRHPNVAAALLLLVIAVALFTPYLTQPNHVMWPRSELGTDMLTYNWPAVYFFREALQKYGEIPLWQGTAAGGLPLTGNPAVRVFYPPQLLVSLLPIPILWGYALLNVFHFWLAGIGSYGLARSVLKVDYPAAILAGLLVMLTPRLSSNVVGDVGYTHGLCWLPLCLLWTRLAFDRRSWRWGLAAGLALGCIYLNNIQFILYAGWLMGLYFVYTCAGLAKDRRPVGEWLQAGAILVTIMAATFGFAAYQALPFISYLPYQSRQAMTLADANYLALPPVGLMNTVFPIAQKFPEWEVYAGLLPLILTPLALLHPARREVVWWMGVLLFVVLFSLGSVTPLYSLMVQVVPGFNLLRVPARMWQVAPIALAMLTALGVEALLKMRTIPTPTLLRSRLQGRRTLFAELVSKMSFLAHPHPPAPAPLRREGEQKRIREGDNQPLVQKVSPLKPYTGEGTFRAEALMGWWWRWLMGSSLVFMLITVAGRYLTRRPDELDWMLGLVTSAGVILMLAALWRWKQGKMGSVTLATVLGVAVVLDLFPLDIAFGRPRSIDDFTQAPAIAQKMIQLAGDTPYRVYSTRREINDPVAVVHNLQTADGLISFQFGAYTRFMRVASGCDLKGLAAAIPACASNEISAAAYRQAQPDPALLGLLNVRYIISTLDLENDALRLVASEGNEKLYENTAVMPRAFAVGRAKASLMIDEYYSEQLQGISGKPIALLPINQADNYWELPDGDFLQEATVTQYSPNRIEIEVDMPDNGILVLGEPWTPGWVAQGGTSSREVLKVDGALRGVYLTTGKHRVVFIFNPPAVFDGLRISLMAVLFSVGVGVLSAIRKRM